MVLRLFGRGRRCALLALATTISPAGWESRWLMHWLVPVTSR